MKILNCLALAFAAALLSTAALAQNAALTDQKAVVDDPKVAEVLKTTTGAREIDEKTARIFGPLLFQDGTLSVNERDLFLELLSTVSGVITISTPSGESFEVPVLSRQARAFMSLVSPPDLATLWLRGPAQMKQLVDITVLDPIITSRVVGYVRQRLSLVWMESTLSEGYKPLRDDLSAAVRQLQATDAETERRGRALIFDAMRQLDRTNGGQIPKYLYDYLGTY